MWDRNGNLVTDRNVFLYKVQGFYTTLYKSNFDLKIPGWIRSSFKWNEKKNRAPGENEVVTEAIQLGESVLINLENRLMNQCLVDHWYLTIIYNV